MHYLIYRLRKLVKKLREFLRGVGVACSRGFTCFPVTSISYQHKAYACPQCEDAVAALRERSTKSRSALPDEQSASPVKRIRSSGAQRTRNVLRKGAARHASSRRTFRPTL